MTTVSHCGGTPWSTSSRAAYVAIWSSAGTLSRRASLGVGDVVAPRAEFTRLVDAQEEVGQAHPVPVEEGRLVDDVDPPAHGVERRRLRLHTAHAEGRDVLDHAALGDETFEVGALVVEALGEDEVEGVVGPAGPGRRPAPGVEGLEVERRDVRAGHVLRQVRGAQDEVTVDALHGAEYAVRHRHPRHPANQFLPNAHERPERG